jgi:hypothetical protein
LPLRVEDLLMAAWVAVVSPILFHASGDKGPFDPDQPLQGVLRLAAVLGVVVCLAARRAVEPGVKPQSSILNRASVGPFIGGLLLVTIGGFTALDAGSQAFPVAFIAIAVLAVAVRFLLPPLPVLARRALVSPFVAVAAGIYWSVIASLTSGNGFVITPQQAVHDPHGVALILGFLAAFSAVYYAMLIFGPRQVAESEGGIVTWFIRYALFLVSIVFGIGWLGVLGT